MSKLIRLVVSICLSTSAFSVSASVQSLCAQQEEIVFSCKIDKKLVSVCASKEISPTGGFIQYRFGKKDAAELLFPKGDLSQRHVKAKSLPLVGGGIAYLRFSNGQFDYVVYQAMSRDLGTRDGVAVLKAGKLARNISCDDLPTAMFNTEYFEKAGLPEDAEDFEIPQ
jgi:hypothetical protein